LKWFNTVSKVAYIISQQVLNQILSEKYFFRVSFSFWLLISAFFAGPPDRLAEAFIFTCELKIGFEVKESILSAPVVFLQHVIFLNCALVCRLFILS
jgi:hypothetical protein